MANFKTHISLGVVLASIVVVGALLYLVVSFSVFLMWLFVAVLVGSFLPDIDLDDGIPFQIFFGLLSVVCATATFYVLYTRSIGDWIVQVLVVLLVFICIRFILGEIFMRFTHHRGIWHSIPAALLCGLITKYCVEDVLRIGDDLIAFYIGAALMIGYIGHLILDEIYATVNLSGGSLLPKRSLGSALKLWAPSKFATVLVYCSILFLLFY